MRARFSPSLALAGLLTLGIAPQLRGDVPQGRPAPRPGTGPGVGAFRPAPAPTGNNGSSARILVPPGRPPIPRPSYNRLAPNASLVYLPTFSRCTVLPGAMFWRNREYDIMAAMQASARQGFIPVTPYPDDQTSVTGTTMVASGWRAYGFLVPPGGQVLLQLQHPKPAWFRVYWTDQWGEYRPGMMVEPGEPEALYINQGKTMTAVYAIVDDPGQWATPTNPFTLVAKRSFDATKLDIPAGMSVHQGIWNVAPETYWLSPEHR